MQATTLIRRTATLDAPAQKDERNFLIVSFGVILPIVVLLIEAFSGWSREIYFDPFGHPMHIACIILVPIANAIGAMTHAGRSSRWLFWASNLNSAALVIGSVYALIYMPIMPFAIFAILIAGVGLLPLSPVLALLASVGVRKRINRLLLDRESRSGWIVHLGLIGAGAGLLMPMVPQVLTCHAARYALGKPGTGQEWGVSWLRSSADVGFLQRRALDQSRRPNITSWLQLTPDDAKKALFLATGKTLESTLADAREEDRRWDPDRGSQVVGAMIPEVEMALSAINSSVDADAGVAYTEWTFAFTNAASIQHEARMEVELPADAVVSRLTLWINGEPQEAAFGTRGQTTAAYQNVVAQRRDPVLVTTAGPNKILVQCFPVPPRGDAMQARIGISSPLRLDAKGKGELIFPQIISRNFTLREEHASQCWIESRSPMIGSALTKWAAPEPGTYALKGERATLRLGESRVRTMAPVEVSYYREPVADGGKIVVQKTESMPRWRPEKLAIVLDSSAGMEAARDELVRALPNLSKDCEVTLLLTRDGQGSSLIPGHLRRLNGVEMTALNRDLEAVHFSGGKPNSGALIEAWKLVSSSPRGAILWLHGPEPSFGVPFALSNNFERHPGSPKVFSMQLNPGENHLVQHMARYPAFEKIRWQPGILNEMFERWAERTEEKRLVREQAKEIPAGARETSAHLMRIWAKDEVDRKVAVGQTQAATTLALANKIVTPVTGAVVLENRAQYQAAGLTPEESGRVPTIPEPGETMLMIITFAFLLGKRWRRRPALREEKA